MELTEAERMMLIKKKEEICGLTLQILDMAHDKEKKLEIKKKFTTTISLLNQIASCSHTKHNLNELTEAINLLFILMDNETLHKRWVASPHGIEFVCNYVNAVKFDFTKKGLKFNIPKMDFSIFKISKSYLPYPLDIFLFPKATIFFW